MQQIIIRDKDKEALRKYLPNIDELVENGDLLEFQIAVMCAIDKTLDKETSEATQETLALEKIYDKVSYDTKIRALEIKYNN